ncbi:MAG TPA: hypothetical protein VJU86_04110 [Pyrinomonadaceae bacterium]|nr:hypothetical protein [Pyrinomonadaceae bacterium]
MPNQLSDLRRRAFLTLTTLLFVYPIFAQTPVERQRRTGPEMVLPTQALDAGLGRTNLECAGYFRMSALPQLPQIVGGEQEQEKIIYSAGDFVYLNAGDQQGVKDGQTFQIIRPRGEPIKVHKQKKGYMGVFIQEVGELKVVKVFPAVSVAQITFACETALEGDLLTGVPDRVSPEFLRGKPFDRFAQPASTTVGRVMMAKDGREMLAAGDTVFVDIGQEDSIAVGKRLTIYRRVGTGNLNLPTYDLARRGSVGFESDHYRGGGLSIQSKRASQEDEGIYRDSPVTTSQIRKKRPAMPWKIVGEAMILNVQERTATAIITSTVQEVHTGDYVAPAN